MSARSYGIGIGASYVKYVEITTDAEGVRICRKVIRNHQCNPIKALQELDVEYGFSSCDYGIITRKKQLKTIEAPFISETECMEVALRTALLKRGRENNEIKPPVLVSLGAECFVLYGLDFSNSVSAVETGSKCASGTGEFFLQRIQSLGISLDKAIELAGNSEPYKLSGRCTVFCKSDCTHALNKGIDVGRVIAGLSRMLVEKILELVEKIPHSTVYTIGGVTNNTAVMQMLSKELSGIVIPQHADAFEAYGAALYALEKRIKPAPISNGCMSNSVSMFSTLPPLSSAKDNVQFKEIKRVIVKAGEKVIIGLDAGSTTTKAVAIRSSDSALAASAYLRTMGNPVRAARECYQEIKNQLGDDIEVIGLGTTGSGRQITALHAGSGSVMINEIIAHATAAASFDKSVDTIFEIGGQDAKYTYLVNGVPSDYAMNEACSAGTGSFLEEAVQESLGINYLQIESVALSSSNPLNFNDQCAGFINSDIKTAVHESKTTEDIVAGLAYSICMNYVNRVKGRRPVGDLVYMQGGVCYNKAVPYAMANLTGKRIVVPPEPGLMGAYGVALVVKNKILNREISEGSWNLLKISEREITRVNKFTCAGEKKCDRKCEIEVMSIDGEKYPFGGACNRYYNLVNNIKIDKDRVYDFIRLREKIVLCGSQTKNSAEKSIGINRSFLTHSLYPFFSTFFTSLGLKVILSDSVDPEGMRHARSSFCFPAEISHGTFYNLLKKSPDFIFLPAITEYYIKNPEVIKREHQCTCVILQAEQYYLQSAFKDEIGSVKVLNLTFNLANGLHSEVEAFVNLGISLGVDKRLALGAFERAISSQQIFEAELKMQGKTILSSLSENTDNYAIVLIGRPYNAFSSDANMGIPGKFASRGITVIPWEFLPFEDESCGYNMCWANGQNIIRACRYIASQPNLFAVYVTNFSCGPDSFLLGHFREIMQDKPSLTLEIDSHTADAGVTTRIEAFLDIVHSFRNEKRIPQKTISREISEIKIRGRKTCYIDSDGVEHKLSDSKVHLLLPSFGKIQSELIAAAFTGNGMNASTIPVYDAKSLQLGKTYATCKECIPLLLTTGGLLRYLQERKNSDELLAYLMPTCGGNCRFTQYAIFIENLIRKLDLKNVALLSLTNENSYTGISNRVLLAMLKAIITADVLDDIQNALNVLAIDRQEAQKVFNEQCASIRSTFEENGGKCLYEVLERVATALKSIPLKTKLSQAITVAVSGEIFVRRDDFSCGQLLKRLSENEIIPKRAPVLEWLAYCDFNVTNRLYQSNFSLNGYFEFAAKRYLRHSFEKNVKKILSKSGLYKYELIDMKTIMNFAGHFFNKQFTGETQLVLGTFFSDILHSFHGMVSIGPFGCMHTRVTEAVLSAEATMSTLRKYRKDCEKINTSSRLPFLSIESDGGSFPQVVETKIEAFCLQVKRLHEKLSSQNSNSALDVTLAPQMVDQSDQVVI